ncbi:MAG: hypothetical protein QNJ14_13450, partial [Woeseiaceae bacterium]|nr:hypothetical protein [Woeseiaceae bacterium]
HARAENFQFTLSDNMCARIPTFLVPGSQNGGRQPIRFCGQPALEYCVIDHVSVVLQQIAKT